MLPRRRMTFNHDPNGYAAQAKGALGYERNANGQNCTARKPWVYDYNYLLAGLAPLL